MAARAFLFGRAAWRGEVRSSRPCRLIRVAGQWIGVGLAHVAVFAGVMNASPQPPLTVSGVIQASLIAPQILGGVQEQAPLEERQELPKPPAKKPRPKKNALSERPVQKLPEKPKPVLLATAADDEAPTFSHEVALPPEPLHSEPAATESDSSTASALAPTSAGHSEQSGNSTSGALIPPVFSADYLENPAPPYPQVSRRRGETGRVLLRVYVSTNGRAERVEINASSGFARLDTAARDAVFEWRFVPARRGSEQVAAWVLIPIAFVM